MSDPQDKHYPKGQTGKPVTLEVRDGLEDGRRFSPSAGRNKAVIAETFARVMPSSGSILEIGSGTGEHGVEITTLIEGIAWTFSEYDLTSHSSISSWIDHGSSERLAGPYHLDAAKDHWGELENQSFAGVFCANTIHISPFDVAKGLFAGASRLLHDDGKLFLYGPFARNGDMSDGNARFDLDLKRRDPSWGVRDLHLELEPLAREHGLGIETIVEMPANNLSVVWKRV
ncbi:MAG: DUF938 domain-containing protein [Pseudomonadota bacterium]